MALACEELNRLQAPKNKATVVKCADFLSMYLLLFLPVYLFISVCCIAFYCFLLLFLFIFFTFYSFMCVLQLPAFSHSHFFPPPHFLALLSLDLASVFLSLPSPPSSLPSDIDVSLPETSGKMHLATPSVASLLEI